MRRLIILTALAVVISLTPRPGAGQQRGEDESVVTVRGTALLPTGEPAANVPIVAKMLPRCTLTAPPPPGAEERDRPGIYQIVGSGSTRADGSFSFQIRTQPTVPTTLLIEFGTPTETPFLRTSKQVDGRELDLKTVQLRPPVKARPRSGGGLCAAISIGLPMALFVTAWPRRRSTHRAPL